MLFGVEYVVAAYVIWICTFAIYILMIKVQIKIAGKTIQSIKERISESSDTSEKKESLEKQD